MSDPHRDRGLSAIDLDRVLGVTRALAAPFDLLTMLAEVVRAAKQVLQASGGSVWLYDAAADELILEVATDMEPIRVPAGTGLVGTCARERRIINVPDCYSDPRFNPEVDRQSGFHTRCMLTLPLVDHKSGLVGVMQVLNKAGGVFDEYDEALATALAAQCAVALQRVRMTEALLEGEAMRQELEMARVVQMSTLPSAMPELGGYDVHGVSRPAGITGGDTFDLANVGPGLLAVLADATGHGIAPALSVTQMQAMLRMAFRLGADLETAFMQANNQLAATLPDDRFITAFIGLLDPASHRMRFLSGGQGPILHYDARTGSCARLKPTAFPLAAMPLAAPRPAQFLDLAQGDILALLTDGIFEACNGAGEEFGEARAEALLRAHGDCSMAELARRVLDAVDAFAGGVPQDDDQTVVLVKRCNPRATSRDFARSFDALEAIFAFTAAFLAEHGADAEVRHDVDFVLEELFTNMVKYGGTTEHAIRIGLAMIERGVEVTLVDRDVEPFDVTRAPEVDVSRPIEERNPGGLGLHLVRRLVDRIEYDYWTQERCSRITFRKTAAPASRTEGGSGAVD